MRLRFFFSPLAFCCLFSRSLRRSSFVFFLGRVDALIAARSIVPSTFGPCSSGVDLSSNTPSFTWPSSRARSSTLAFCFFCGSAFASALGAGVAGASAGFFSGCSALGCGFSALGTGAASGFFSSAGFSPLGAFFLGCSAGAAAFGSRSILPTTFGPTCGISVLISTAFLRSSLAFSFLRCSCRFSSCRVWRSFSASLRRCSSV